MFILKKLKQCEAWFSRKDTESYTNGNQTLFPAVDGMWKSFDRHKCVKKQEQKKQKVNLIPLKKIQSNPDKKVNYSRFELRYYAKRLDKIGVKCRHSDRGWSHYWKTRVMFDDRFNRQINYATPRRPRKKVALDVQAKVDLYFWNPPIEKICIHREFDKIWGAIQEFEFESYAKMQIYLHKIGFSSEEKGRLNPALIEERITKDKNYWFTFLRNLERVWDKIRIERDRDMLLEDESEDEIILIAK
jgi:hypothetical protein